MNIEKNDTNRDFVYTNTVYKKQEINFTEKFSLEHFYEIFTLCILEFFFSYRLEMQTDLLTKKNRVLKKVTAIKVNCNKQPSLHIIKMIQFECYKKRKLINCHGFVVLIT